MSDNIKTQVRVEISKEDLKLMSEQIRGAMGRGGTTAVSEIQEKLKGMAETLKKSMSGEGSGFKAISNASSSIATLIRDIDKAGKITIAMANKFDSAANSIVKMVSSWALVVNAQDSAKRSAKSLTDVIILSCDSIDKKQKELNDRLRRLDNLRITEFNSANRSMVASSAKMNLDITKAAETSNRRILSSYRIRLMGMADMERMMTTMFGSELRRREMLHAAHMANSARRSQIAMNQSASRQQNNGPVNLGGGWSYIPPGGGFGGNGYSNANYQGWSRSGGGSRASGIGGPPPMIPPGGGTAAGNGGWGNWGFNFGGAWQAYNNLGARMGAVNPAPIPTRIRPQTPFGQRLGDAVMNTAAYTLAAAPMYYGRMAINRGIDRQEGIFNALSIGSDKNKDTGIYESYDKLSTSIFNIANRSGLAASEVDKLALSIAQAGLNGKESEKILTAMATATRLSFGKLDPDTAIAGFNSLKNTFFKDVKDPAEQATKAVEGLEKAIYLANKSATSPSELITAFSRLGASASLAGMNAEQAMVWLTRATELSGQSPVTLATATTRILSRMSAPDTEKYIESERGLNISMRDDSGKFKSQKKVLEEIAVLFRELDKAGNNHLINQHAVMLAGAAQKTRFIALIEAILDVEKGTAQLSASHAENLRKMDLSNQSLSASFRKLWNSVEHGFLSIGNDESGAIKLFKNTINAVTESIEYLGSDGIARAFDTLGLAVLAFASTANTALAPVAATLLLIKGAVDLRDIAQAGKDAWEAQDKTTAQIAAQMKDADKSETGKKTTEFLFKKFGLASIADMESPASKLWGWATGNGSPKDIYGRSGAMERTEMASLFSAAYSRDTTLGMKKSSMQGIFDATLPEEERPAYIAAIKGNHLGKINEYMMRAIKAYSPKASISEEESQDLAFSLGNAFMPGYSADERFKKTGKFIDSKKASQKAKDIREYLKAAEDLITHTDETMLELGAYGADIDVKELEGLRHNIKGKRFAHLAKIGADPNLDPEIAGNETPMSKGEIEKYEGIRSKLIAREKGLNDRIKGQYRNIEVAGKMVSASEKKIDREAQELLNRQKKEIANRIDAFFGGYIKDIAEQYSPEEIERFGAISKPIGASPSQMVGTLISDAMTAISQNPASLLESIDVISIYDNVSEAIGKAVGESIMLNAGEGSIALEQTKRMLQVGKFALGLGLGAGTYGGLREVSYGGAGAMGLNVLGFGKGMVPASKAVDADLKTKFDDAAKAEEKAKRELQEETNQWLKKIEKSTDKMAEKGSIETSLESALMSMMSGGGTGGFSGIKDSIIGSITGRFVDSARGGALGGRTIQSLFGGLEFAAKYGSEYSNVADQVNQGWIHGAGNVDKMGIAMTDMTLAASGNNLAFGNAGSAGIGGVLSKAGAGSSLAAGAKAGAAEGLIGGAAKTLITGIGTVMTIWAAVEAVNSIANAIGIGGTRVRHDDRPLVDQQNEMLAQSHQSLMSAATSGQYTSSHIREAYAYKPTGSSVYETTSDRGFFDKLFKGKDSHYYSDNAALASINKIEKMQYESIMAAGELELEYGDREVKMQLEKLDRMNTVIGLQKELLGKGKEIDLPGLAQKEIEAMTLRRAIFNDALNTSYVALGTTQDEMNIRSTTKKYDPLKIGTDGDLRRYFNSYTTGYQLKANIRDPNNLPVGFTPMESHASIFGQAITGALSTLNNSGISQEALTGFINNNPGINAMYAASQTDSMQTTRNAIGLVTSQLESLGENSEVADELAALVAIGIDMLSVQESMLRIRISDSETAIASKDYLANIESSNKSISDIEKSTNISYSSFADKLSSGSIGSIGGDSWTYRNQAISDRLSAISQFSGGAFSGTDLMQNLYNASFIEAGIGRMTGREESEKTYVKQLITELASAVSGMFGAYTDNSSAANNEDAKMYEVGSSGKYYITQNFTVESTYFGGSQAEAVQFLKFLSKAWNDSGSKNTTQRLF